MRWSTGGTGATEPRSRRDGKGRLRCANRCWPSCEAGSGSNKKPIMIGFMEMTCRNTVLPLLDAGYDTVGTHVNVAHLAASPIGMSVTFTAEVIRVDGRRVEFRVEARDEKEKIGEGTHERAIINIAKFATRLAQKMG